MDSSNQDPRAPVLEAFASIQGEGRYVGQPQVFLRLAGCPLRCAWCDTPHSWVVKDGGRARVAAPGGVRREDALVDARAARAWIDELDPSGAMPVSVTGGEPALWPDFVAALARELGGRRLHLETAGAHPRALARIADDCDHLSIDLKLPMDLGAPVEVDAAGPDTEPAPRTDAEWRDARRAVLALARGRDAALKVVVAGGRDATDYDELLDDARELCPDAPLVVQPATPIGGVAAPDNELTDAVLAAARGRGLDARLLPQLHRLLGLP